MIVNPIKLVQNQRCLECKAPFIEFLGITVGEVTTAICPKCAMKLEDSIARETSKKMIYIVKYHSRSDQYGSSSEVKACSTDRDRLIKWFGDSGFDSPLMEGDFDTWEWESAYDEDYCYVLSEVPNV